MARIIWLGPALEADYPPLMLSQVTALRAYAHDHGRTWKAKLWAEWMNATAEPLLHGLRNTHGPRWLERFDLACRAARFRGGKPCRPVLDCPP
ncbi:MAG: hypothetical protein WKF40_09895 [Thermoleophilaceae bacterium]